MLPGETVASGAPSTCAHCFKDLENEVLRSAADYYIGTICDDSILRDGSGSWSVSAARYQEKGYGH